MSLFLGRCCGRRKGCLRPDERVSRNIALSRFERHRLAPRVPLADLLPLAYLLAIPKQAKQDAGELLTEKAQLETERVALEQAAVKSLGELQKKVGTIGNIVHASVPVSTTEDDNVQLKTWHPDGPNARVEKRDDILSHHEVMHRLDILDQERGTKVAGHRGFFLINDGVDLNQALISYGLDFLRKKSYKKVMTPFMMKRNMMAKTAQLSEFDEALYKLEGGADEDDEKYLIATSEQPLSAYHADEWFDAPEKQLPLKWVKCGTGVLRGPVDPD